MPALEPQIEPTQLQAEVVAVAVVVYTREAGKTKPVQRIIALTPSNQRSLLNFIKHKLQGGVLRTSKLPDEREERRIITL